MKRERAGGREKRERGERKTFLLPPLLAIEAISIVRREEREEHWRDGGGIFLLLPLTSVYAFMHERRKEDEKERGFTRERERERERERMWEGGRAIIIDGERSTRRREREREERERDPLFSLIIFS